MLDNVLLYFLSSLFCSSSLYPSLLYMIVCVCQVLYFIAPKTSFVKLWVCVIFLTGNYKKLCTAVGSPVPSVGPILCHPMLIFTCAASYVPTSQGLCSRTRATFLCTMTLCENDKYLILPTITVCYCYLYKTKVVPHKDKHERNRLPVDTRSSREIAVTAKLSKSYQQVKESSDVASPEAF